MNINIIQLHEVFSYNFLFHLKSKDLKALLKEAKCIVFNNCSQVIRRFNQIFLVTLSKWHWIKLKVLKAKEAICTLIKKNKHTEDIFVYYTMISSMLMTATKKKCYGFFPDFVFILYGAWRWLKGLVKMLAQLSEWVLVLYSL